MITGAVIICLYCLRYFPVGKVDGMFFGLLAATVLLSFLHFQLPRLKLHLSVSEAVVFFALLLYSIEVSVIIAVTESLLASYSFRRKNINLKFQTIFDNASFAVFSAFIPGLVVTKIFPVMTTARDYDDLPLFVVLLSVLVATHFFVNSLIVATYTSLKTKRNFWSVWSDNFFNLLLIFTVEAMIAGLLTKTVENINPILLLATAGIAIIAYFTFRRYTKDLHFTAAKAEQAERERAEQAEQHVDELQHYIGELEKTSDALRESKNRFRHAAFHDELTGLPNRNKFTEQLRFLLDKSKEKPELQFAVLFLDLNRFKTINDSLGYAIGNRLLLNVAKRLTNILREGDIVARFGGDEFAVLLCGIENITGVIEYAEIVSQKIAKPYTIGGRQVFTSVSIGIAVGHSRYEEAEELLRDADIAMYHAKETEKNFAVFDQNMHLRAVQLMQIETDLRLALECNELVAFYQPIINLDTLELIGFESLMRWQHPQRGLVPPVEFIPVSELTGLIVPMTLWMLQTSCEQIVKWQNLDSANQNLMISVNLSGKHFTQPDLVEQIHRILNETKLRPECLKLEITESAVMENAETAIRMLRQMRQLGVQLSIDDFGTGYSSLSYLHRFPINTLKVDRSFVSTMEEGSENGEIVRTIVALAKALNLNVIAEGIESIHQLHQLRILGCEYGQGYLFSRPVPAEESEKIVLDRERWRSILPHNNFAVFGQSNEFSSLEIGDFTFNDNAEH